MKSFDVEKILARSRGDRMRRRAEVDAARKASRALYSDDAGEPTLLPSFVVYLDELGTAARLGGMTNDDLRADLRAYDDLRWFLHDDSTDWDADSQRILYFSDNLVVAAPLDGATDKCDFGLFYHIWAAGAYQLNMALRGRMLRGGITAGDAYADDTFVTGPALGVRSGRSPRWTRSSNAAPDYRGGRGCCPIRMPPSSGDHESVAQAR